MSEQNSILDQATEPAFEYPCDFEIKAMGPASDDFDAIVAGIIRKYVDDLKEGAVTTRQSSGGKFTSVTVKFYADNAEQVKSIYQALGEQKEVKYVL